MHSTVVVHATISITGGQTGLNKKETLVNYIRPVERCVYVALHHSRGLAAMQNQRATNAPGVYKSQLRPDDCWYKRKSHPLDHPHKLQITVLSKMLEFGLERIQEQRRSPIKRANGAVQLIFRRPAWTA